MSAYLPHFFPGKAVTFTAGADVTGGRLVAVSGPMSITHANDDDLAVVGVAGDDTKQGDLVVVYSGGVQKLVASGAISAGEIVGLASDGCVSSTGDIKVGIALTGAANDELVSVHMGALIDGGN